MTETEKERESSRKFDSDRRHQEFHNEYGI